MNTKIKCLVLNLDSRADRYQTFIQENENICEITRISAIHDSIGRIGCFKSHQKALQYHKEIYPNQNCLVLEDDCELIGNYISKWKIIKEWLDEHSDVWDIFLGGTTGITIECISECVNPELDLIRLREALTCHFIYYNKNIFDQVINLDPTIEPIDVALSKTFRNRIVIRVPFIAKQSTSFSDIEKCNVDYTALFTASQNIIINYYPTVYMTLMGGIGNQLFQFASVYSIAKRTNRRYILNGKGNDIILKDMNRVSEIPQPHVKLIEPIGLGLSYLFDSINSNQSQVLALTGYFQSERYFYEYKNEIISIIRSNLSEVPLIDACPSDMSEYVFIHIRRGDYLTIPLHNVDLNQYYNDAINFHRKKYNNTKFILFSDDPDPLRLSIRQEHIYIPPKINDLQTLVLMSQCKGGIGCNSTFSWWGGYIASQKDIIVTYPDKWVSADWNVDIWWQGCYKYNSIDRTFTRYTRAL